MLIVGYYNFDVDLLSGRIFVRDQGATADPLGTHINLYFTILKFRSISNYQS